MNFDSKDLKMKFNTNFCESVKFYKNLFSLELSQKFKPIVQKTSFSGSPKEFNDLLLSRNLNSLQRKSALKNKFPELSDLELSNLVF